MKTALDRLSSLSESAATRNMARSMAIFVAVDLFVLLGAASGFTFLWNTFAAPFMGYNPTTFEGTFLILVLLEVLALATHALLANKVR